MLRLPHFTHATCSFFHQLHGHISRENDDSPLNLGGKIKGFSFRSSDPNHRIVGYTSMIPYSQKEIHYGWLNPRSVQYPRFEKNAPDTLEKFINYLKYGGLRV